MSVNLGKTQVIVFRNGGQLGNYKNWTYNLQPLKKVSVYKCMGLLFSHAWGKTHLKLTAQAKRVFKQQEDHDGHISLT